MKSGNILNSGLRKRDFDIKIKGKKYNCIRAFSILWWLITVAKAAAIVGAFYGFYILMWTLI